MRRHVSRARGDHSVLQRRRRADLAHRWRGRLRALDVHDHQRHEFHRRRQRPVYGLNGVRAGGPGGNRRVQRRI